MDLIDKLKRRVKKENIVDSKDLMDIIIDEMFVIYVNNDIIVNKINYSKEGPTVILFVGVNGVGKTTTIGKIAYKLKKEGKKVLLVAGDTFRAGAVEQIKEWGIKTNCEVCYKDTKDAASVIYDGLEKAKNENYDVVLIDTAGRLQNKVNLMNELEKINKVIGKIIPNAPHEVLLVIDATSGQNGISQAKSFKEITNITGIVLTKLDGTAKGGIVLAIKEKVGIPVKFIGLGEKEEDLKVFDIENISMDYLEVMMKTRKVIDLKETYQITLLFQIALIVFIISFGILSIFNKDLFIICEVLISVMMFVLAFNNQKVYKRKYMTYVYMLFGILLLVSLFI